MRNGGDRRGSAKARRRRAQELLDIYGDGETCRCVHCGALVTTTDRLESHPGAVRMEQDRIDARYSYTADNVQPACGLCNKRRSNKPERFTLERAWLTSAGEVTCTR